MFIRVDAPARHAHAQQLLWYAAPLAALLYPLPLMGFHALITSPPASGGYVHTFAAGLLLLLAFLVPVLALVLAMHLSMIENPSPAQRHARRIALLAVAAPPMFVFGGAVFFMLGIAPLLAWVFPALWIVLAITIAFSDKAPSTQVVTPHPASLRIAHGVLALLVLLVFLAAHIANHFFGLIGVTAYTTVMKLLRHIYRTPVVEPLLLAGFFSLIISGFYMAWKFTAQSTDRFRTFQMASGIYLMFFLISHIDAVLILARRFLGIDSDWAFATGAPAGLIHDAFNIYLVPYYWFAVFFVLSHLASGARAVMLAHGSQKSHADGVHIFGMALSALAATLILLGMTGLRIYWI